MLKHHDFMKLVCPMTPEDCFQTTLLAQIECNLNILADRAKPKSRRWNQLMAMKEKLDLVDETFEGHFPDNWVAESEKFFVTTEATLTRLMKSFRSQYNKSAKTDAINVYQERRGKCSATDAQ